MQPKAIAVLGGGIAGLAASLALARAGHPVVLLERDALAAGEPAAAPSWPRGGIPHFLQPHAFIPRGRLELMEGFPDVYQSLIHAGACDVDVRRKLPGPGESADEVLQYMAVRRPLLEWGLRKAALAEAGIDVVSPATVTGLRVTRGRVSGVEAEGRIIEADLVVDAMGRRSQVRAWLEARGLDAPALERSECGVIYYSRYYSLRPGCELPDGPWILSPRGDLGYMGFSSFPGDNGTFAVVLGVPTGVAELKVFADERVFEAMVARIPLLSCWANPGIARPITPVLPMGGLQNSILKVVERRPTGWLPVSDAICHTDPWLAHGLSFALIHARELARAVQEHDDLGEAVASYQARVVPLADERYRLAEQLDSQRLRMWTGQSVDFSRRDGDAALFSFVAAGAVAMVDPEVFRVFVRRFGLLDRTQVFDGNEPLQRRVEAGFRELIARPRPASGPSREEALELARAARST